MVGGTFTTPVEFGPITGIFKMFCSDQGLELLSQAVERHGSWEWSACQKADLNRYTTLMLTDEPENPLAPRIYIVEVWAEADNSQRFTRRLVATYRVNHGAFAHREFTQRLTDALKLAWQHASGIKEPDLTESYGRMRLSL